MKSLVTVALIAAAALAINDPATREQAYRILYPTRFPAVTVEQPPAVPPQPAAPVLSPAKDEPAKEVVHHQPEPGRDKAQPASADQERPARAKPPQNQQKPVSTKTAKSTPGSGGNARQMGTSKVSTTSETYDSAILYPCWMICRHMNGKSKDQLLADKAYYQPTPRQERHGRVCVVNTCPNNVPADVLAEMKRELGRR